MKSTLLSETILFTKKPFKMKNLLSSLFGLCLLMCLISCQDENVGSLELDHEKHVHVDRTCGTTEHMQTLMANPDFKAKHLKKIEKVSQMVSNRSTNCTNRIVLPVAIHFQGVSNPDADCLRALAQNQIDILNADFKGTNSDINKWTQNAASSFPGISNGDACLEFCIATKNHPTGYGLSEGDPAVTINKTNGDNDSNWSGYLNMFIQTGTGVLGYAPLGGSGNGDGVVIESSAFGSGAGCGSTAPQAPYNLGRTTTHEVGHYLLLDHIWGGGCSQDDDVSDTPDSNEPYYGCPSIGASSCNSTDMHMNYMDYTNDACMYMISAGQASRMNNYTTSSLQNLISNAGNVCDSSNGDGNTPTCNDGIQNGQETGVDCGGPDCAPCSEEPSCNDGIQNGQETGVDCGGPECTPCQTDGVCETPSIFNVQVISASKVKISWNAVPDAIKYRIFYRIKGSGNAWVKRSSSTNSKVLTGLTTDVQYEYKVRTKCPEGWTSFSPLQLFMINGTSGSDCEGTLFQFELVLDYYGSETSWELVDDFGEVIAAGGPYQDGQEGKVITEEFCLEDGCYSLFVDDTYGDGICCDYGSGSFAILDEDGNVLADSDGYFGNYDVLDFCTDGGFFKEGDRKTDSKNKSLARKPYSSNH